MTDKNKPLVITTRGSKLALWQANYVSSLLKKFDVETELQVTKTEGDRVQNRFLHEIGGKGLFVKELEKSLQAGTADLAVHSLKDLPAQIPDGFRLTAILPRHSPKDAIIFHPDCKFIADLPAKELTAADLLKIGPLTIATSSLRRTTLLRNTGSDFTIKPVRGNVDTRINKLLAGKWDALILAAASLDRLKFTGLVSRTLASDWFIPSPAQGSLAIETTLDHPYANTIRQLNCRETEFCSTLERKILGLLGGDCSLPFGCFVEYDHEEVSSRTVVLNYEGIKCEVNETITSSLSMTKIPEIASTIVQKLYDLGVEKLLNDIKTQDPGLGELE